MTGRTSGHQAVRILTEAGIRHLFTLSGGHIFPLYEGARHEGLQLIDVRHEQTAGFAAEGLAKLTRSPQVAALTAGPGVTNAMRDRFCTLEWFTAGCHRRSGTRRNLGQGRPAGA